MSVHAPYNFVPLSRTVYFPPWADKVSHDVPFKDGLCGSLRLRITAHTPLLVGGKQTKPTDHDPGTVEAFLGPDKQPAIPGSTLKGMIRAVLEIASFGKMASVDDRTLSLRDLTGAMKEDYAHRVRNAQPGWLSYDEAKGWRIQCCKMARVLQSDITKDVDNFQRDPKSKRGNFKGRSAPDKYGFISRSLRVSAIISKKVIDGREIVMATDIIDINSGNKGRHVDGVLVFTGQPSPQKSKEFFFYQNSDDLLSVDDATMAKFLSIHNNLPEWEHWGEALRSGEAVPVFYNIDNGMVSSFGLAQMYKLAYEKSIHDMIGQCSAQHLAETLDLAETIFGRVGKAEGDALRGRVSVSLARLTGRAGPIRPDLKPSVMSSPKPGFVPSYVRQIDLVANGRQLRPGAQYQSYMDETTSLRGWKRYPVHPQDQVKQRVGNWPAPPTASGTNSQVVLKPIVLEKDAYFTADLRFHNLRPMELGALLWVLTWGGQGDLRHSLGMGKPFGFGQISIAVDEAASTIIANQPGQSPPNPAACQAGFVAVMNKTVPGWLSSAQLRQLCAMANPANEAFNRPLSYMSLVVGGRNDFVEAKKLGCVLPEYAGGPPTPDGPEPTGPLHKPPPSHEPRRPAGNPRRDTASPAPAVVSHRAQPLARSGAAVRYDGEDARLDQDVSPAISPQSMVRIRFDDGEEIEVPWGSLKLS